MSQDDENGDLVVLGLLERMRVECRKAYEVVSELHWRMHELEREVANPNLPKFPIHLPYRIEMWDRRTDGLRWVTSINGSVTIARAAFNAAINEYPGERWTLRNGMAVLQEYEPPAVIR